MKILIYKDKQKILCRECGSEKLENKFYRVNLLKKTGICNSCKKEYNKSNSVVD